VRFWARLRSQKRSDKRIDAGHVRDLASGASHTPLKITRPPRSSKPLKATWETPQSGLEIASGDFNANAAWVTLAAITQNLLRAAGCLVSLFYAKARGATIREDLIKVPARLARTGRGGLTLHAPQHWHAEAACLALHAAVRAPAAAAA